MSDDQSTTAVEYREIPRYVGYRFGSDGSAWSCWTRIRRSGELHSFTILMTDRWVRLKGTPDKDGYIRFTLKDAILGRNITRKLYHMVLEAFVGPRPPGTEARHMDGCKTNDRLENLQWSTHAVNIADKRRHGTHQVGTKHGMAKLTEEKVVMIRKQYAAGMRSGELGRIYGVTASTILVVCNGQAWRHVTDGLDPPRHQR